MIPFRMGFRFLGTLAFAGLLAGCAGSAPPPTFDLTASGDVPGARAGRAQLVVTEFAATDAINSTQILARRNGQISAVSGAQWSERLPRLVQTRLIQTFENDRRLAAVGRPDDRLAAEATLVGEIRAFGLDGDTGQATVTVAAKIVNVGTGRIVAAQLFTQSVPSAAAGPAVARALDGALQSVLRQVVMWADSRV